MHCIDHTSECKLTNSLWISEEKSSHYNLLRNWNPFLITHHQIAFSSIENRKVQHPLMLEIVTTIMYQPTLPINPLPLVNESFSCGCQSIRVGRRCVSWRCDKGCPQPNRISHSSPISNVYPPINTKIASPRLWNAPINSKLVSNQANTSKPFQLPRRDELS